MALVWIGVLVEIIKTALLYDTSNNKNTLLTNGIPVCFLTTRVLSIIVLRGRALTLEDFS